MNNIKIISSIELWPLDHLVPYANNARTHSQAQVAQTRDGIVAGHARLLAARQLQLALVPVIVLAGLSDIQKRGYILADNQLALNAGWDDDRPSGAHARSCAAGSGPSSGIHDVHR